VKREMGGGGKILGGALIARIPLKRIGVSERRRTRTVRCMSPPVSAVWIAVGVAVAVSAIPVAVAHRTAWASTVPKAERVVRRDATILLPPDVRASLADEFAPTETRFRDLEHLAWEVRDDQAAARFHNFRYRLSTALNKVQGGLSIVAATCRGRGAVSTGRRSKHFSCVVQSEVVEIPLAEVTWPESASIPTVAEVPPRLIGPVRARLFVHVTGKSSIAYR